MTEEQATRLEEKLDRITPIIEALGAVLVRQKAVTERVGIHRNTLAGQDAFDEIGKRKTYIEIGEISAIKRRKRTKKGNR